MPKVCVPERDAWAWNVVQYVEEQQQKEPLAEHSCGDISSSSHQKNSADTGGSVRKNGDGDGGSFPTHPVRRPSEAEVEPADMLPDALTEEAYRVCGSPYAQFHPARENAHDASEDGVEKNCPGQHHDATLNAGVSSANWMCSFRMLDFPTVSSAQGVMKMLIKPALEIYASDGEKHQAATAVTRPPPPSPHRSSQDPDRSHETTSSCCPSSLDPPSRPHSCDEATGGRKQEKADHRLGEEEEEHVAEVGDETLEAIERLVCTPFPPLWDHHGDQAIPEITKTVPPHARGCGEQRRSSSASRCDGDETPLTSSSSPKEQEDRLLISHPKSVVEAETKEAPHCYCLFRGIQNLGNTCYLNSVLQLLSIIAPLRRAILMAGVEEYQFDEAGVWTAIRSGDASPATSTEKKPSLMESGLKETFAQMAFSRDPSGVDPTSFATHLGLNPLRQQDAAECLTLLLDWLEQAGGSMVKQSIEQTLQGSFLYDRRCKVCGHSMQREESFLFLSLPVRETLEQGIEAALQPEEVEGCSCSGCGKNTDVTSYTYLRRLPPTLCVHWNRFEFDMTRMERKKVNRPVAFPHRLDLTSVSEQWRRSGDESALDTAAPPLPSPLPHSPSADPRSTETELSAVDGVNSVVYELVGVLRHHGPSAYSGHYTFSQLVDPVEEWEVYATAEAKGNFPSSSSNPQRWDSSGQPPEGDGARSHQTTTSLEPPENLTRDRQSARDLKTEMRADKEKGTAGSALPQLYWRHFNDAEVSISVCKDKLRTSTQPVLQGSAGLSGSSPDALFLDEDVKDEGHHEGVGAAMDTRSSVSAPAASAIPLLEPGSAGWNANDAVAPVDLVTALDEAEDTDDEDETIRCAGKAAPHHPQTTDPKAAQNGASLEEWNDLANELVRESAAPAPCYPNDLHPPPTPASSPTSGAVAELPSDGSATGDGQAPVSGALSEFVQRRNSASIEPDEKTVVSTTAYILVYRRVERPQHASTSSSSGTVEGSSGDGAAPTSEVEQETRNNARKSNSKGETAPHSTADTSLLTNCPHPREFPSYLLHYLRRTNATHVRLHRKSKKLFRRTTNFFLRWKVAADALFGSTMPWQVTLPQSALFEALEQELLEQQDAVEQEKDGETTTQQKSGETHPHWCVDGKENTKSRMNGKEHSTRETHRESSPSPFVLSEEKKARLLEDWDHTYYALPVKWLYAWGRCFIPLHELERLQVFLRQVALTKIWCDRNRRTTLAASKWPWCAPVVIESSSIRPYPCSVVHHRTGKSISWLFNGETPSVPRGGESVSGVAASGRHSQQHLSPVRRCMDPHTTGSDDDDEEEGDAPHHLPDLFSPLTTDLREDMIEEMRCPHGHIAPWGNYRLVSERHIRHLLACFTYRLPSHSRHHTTSGDRKEAEQWSKTALTRNNKSNNRNPMNMMQNPGDNAAQVSHDTISKASDAERRHVFEVGCGVHVVPVEHFLKALRQAGLLISDPQYRCATCSITLAACVTRMAERTMWDTIAWRWCRGDYVEGQAFINKVCRRKGMLLQRKQKRGAEGQENASTEITKITEEDEDHPEARTWPPYTIQSVEEAKEVVYVHRESLHVWERSVATWIRATEEAKRQLGTQQLVRSKGDSLTHSTSMSRSSSTSTENSVKSESQRAGRECSRGPECTRNASASLGDVKGGESGSHRVSEEEDDYYLRVEDDPCFAGDVDMPEKFSHFKGEDFIGRISGALQSCYLPPSTFRGAARHAALRRFASNTPEKGGKNTKQASKRTHQSATVDPMRSRIKHEIDTKGPERCRHREGGNPEEVHQRVFQLRHFPPSRFLESFDLMANMIKTVMLANERGMANAQARDLHHFNALQQPHPVGATQSRRDNLLYEQQVEDNARIRMINEQFHRHMRDNPLTESTLLEPHHEGKSALEEGDKAVPVVDTFTGASEPHNAPHPSSTCPLTPPTTSTNAGTAVQRRIVTAPLPRSGSMNQATSSAAGVGALCRHGKWGEGTELIGIPRLVALYLAETVARSGLWAASLYFRRNNGSSPPLARVNSNTEGATPVPHNQEHLAALSSSPSTPYVMQELTTLAYAESVIPSLMSLPMRMEALVHRLYQPVPHSATYASDGPAPHRNVAAMNAEDAPSGYGGVDPLYSSASDPHSFPWKSCGGEEGSQTSPVSADEVERTALPVLYRAKACQECVDAVTRAAVAREEAKREKILQCSQLVMLDRAGCLTSKRYLNLFTATYTGGEKVPQRHALAREVHPNRQLLISVAPQRELDQLQQLHEAYVIQRAAVLAKARKAVKYWEENYKKSCKASKGQSHSDPNHLSNGIQIRYAKARSGKGKRRQGNSTNSHSTEQSTLAPEDQSSLESSLSPASSFVGCDSPPSASPPPFTAVTRTPEEEWKAAQETLTQVEKAVLTPEGCFPAPERSNAPSREKPWSGGPPMLSVSTTTTSSNVSPLLTELPPSHAVRRLGLVPTWWAAQWYRWAHQGEGHQTKHLDQKNSVASNAEELDDEDECLFSESESEEETSLWEEESQSSADTPSPAVSPEAGAASTTTTGVRRKAERGASPRPMKKISRRLRLHYHPFLCPHGGTVLETSWLDPQSNFWSDIGPRRAHLLFASAPHLEDFLVSPTHDGESGEGAGGQHPVGASDRTAGEPPGFAPHQMLFEDRRGGGSRPPPRKSDAQGGVNPIDADGEEEELPLEPLCTPADATTVGKKMHHDEETTPRSRAEAEAERSSKATASSPDPNRSEGGFQMEKPRLGPAPSSRDTTSTPTPAGQSQSRTVGASTTSKNVFPPNGPAYAGDVDIRTAVWSYRRDMERIAEPYMRFYPPLTVLPEAELVEVLQRYAPAYLIAEEATAEKDEGSPGTAACPLGSPQQPLKKRYTVRWEKLLHLQEIYDPPSSSSENCCTPSTTTTPPTTHPPNPRSLFLENIRTALSLPTCRACQEKLLKAYKERITFFSANDPLATLRVQCFLQTLRKRVLPPATLTVRNEPLPLPYEAHGVVAEDDARRRQLNEEIFLEDLEDLDDSGAEGEDFYSTGAKEGEAASSQEQVVELDPLERDAARAFHRTTRASRLSYRLTLLQFLRLLREKMLKEWGISCQIEYISLMRGNKKPLKVLLPPPPPRQRTAGATSSSSSTAVRPFSESTTLYELGITNGTSLTLMCNNAKEGGMRGFYHSRNSPNISAMDPTGPSGFTIQQYRTPDDNGRGGGGTAMGIAMEQDAAFEQTSLSPGGRATHASGAAPPNRCSAHPTSPSRTAANGALAASGGDAAEFKNKTVRFVNSHPSTAMISSRDTAASLTFAAEPLSESAEEAQIACPVCTFLNASGMRVCEICESPLS